MKAKTEPLKEQEKFPEGTKNETDLSTLPDPEFKKELKKILKELRKATDRNAGHCNQGLETKKRSQLKLQNSFAKTNTELKAKNSKLNNAEKQISDQEYRIMENTQ